MDVTHFPVVSLIIETEFRDGVPEPQPTCQDSHSSSVWNPLLKGRGVSPLRADLTPPLLPLLTLKTGLSRCWPVDGRGGERCLDVHWLNLL